MREAFIALNDLVLARLAGRGHGDVRATHTAVFQYLDDTGTTVSTLAARAQTTKQAMAELVQYLEARDNLRREPDPEWGREVVAFAQDLVPRLEDRITAVLGAAHVEVLRADLDMVRETARL